MLISTMVVLPPVETPMLSDNVEVDFEELGRRAATKKIEGESDRDVQPVELPWGRGYRSLSRRPHGQEQGDETTTTIEYQVKAPATPSRIGVLGQVPGAAGARTEGLIDDIARMVSSIAVFL
jgi:hypothetical protein